MLSEWGINEFCHGTGAIASFPGFPAPVFDHLQYAKMKVECLGDLVTWDDVR